jgi:hypothetical protein
MHHMQQEISDDMEDYDHVVEKEKTYPIHFYKPQRILEESSEDIELCTFTRVPKIHAKPVFEPFCSALEVEVIKEENPNIELSSVSLNRIKRYRTTLYKDILTKSDDVCVICCTQFVPNAKVITLKCVHYFHSKCVIPWMVSKKRCPTCRMRIY